MEKVRELRNFIFGVEDSLVSTVGVVSGVAWAGAETKIILLTAIVLVCVEAFSMGIGSLLTENISMEYENHRTIPLKASLKSALIMFFSYLLAGTIPIAPYIFLKHPVNLILSVTGSVVALFVLGLISAKVTKTGFLKEGTKLMVLGSLAVAVGVGVAVLMS